MSIEIPQEIDLRAYDKIRVDAKPPTPLGGEPTCRHSRWPVGSFMWTIDLGIYEGFDKAVQSEKNPTIRSTLEKMRNHARTHL